MQLKGWNPIALAKKGLNKGLDSLNATPTTQPLAPAPTGEDGTIDSIFVGHDLDGNMSAENTVGHLKVNGLYNGDVTANGVRVPEH